MIPLYDDEHVKSQIFSQDCIKLLIVRKPYYSQEATDKGRDFGCHLNIVDLGIFRSLWQVISQGLPCFESWYAL